MGYYHRLVYGTDIKGLLTQTSKWYLYQMCYYHGLVDGTYIKWVITTDYNMVLISNGDALSHTVLYILFHSKQWCRERG